jgi:hypothetical protein
LDSYKESHIQQMTLIIFLVLFTSTLLEGTGTWWPLCPFSFRILLEGHLVATWWFLFELQNWT